MSVARESVAWLLVLAAPALVQAQGLATPGTGTAESTAATPDPVAVAFNPAMTSFLERPELFLGGSLVVGDVRYRRDYRAAYQREDQFDFALPIVPASVDQSKAGQAEAVRANPVAVAPSLFLAVPLARQRVTLGLGVHSPYAAVLNLPENGPQRFQIQSATIATVFTTATASFRLHRRLSVAGGVSYVAGFAELSRVQDFAALGDVGDALARPPISQANDFGPDAPPGVRELDVLARPFVFRRGWAHAATFNVGVAAEPIDGLFLGASYQHGAEMRFRGRFGLDMDDDFFTQDLASQGLEYAPRVRGSATLSVPLPAVLRFAARAALTERLGVAVEVAYTRWSAVDRFSLEARSPDLPQPELGLGETTRIDLPRNWRDTIGIDVVGSLRVRGGAMLYGRLGFRQAAVPDATIDLASPDGDRVVAALGTRFGLTERTQLALEAGAQTTFERRVVGSTNDLGNGTYRLTLVHATAALRIALGRLDREG